MYIINKITTNNVVDFAAEELKKYLRMMIPECGEIEILTNALATDGFRLGLMQDFMLDVSDAKDTTLDDIIYIDCNEHGGVIAGDNPRSVLIAVYEYLRQNGCRWLLPGIDGEYIPMQDIKPVKYRHKPSCRFRGWCIEGAQFQGSILESIDLCPKLGMNVYLIQYHNPYRFYNKYYSHIFNTENRKAENISTKQTLQWKRQCEAEISKRGLQLHDIGHGFTYLPFGIESVDTATSPVDAESLITPVQRQYLAEINGERKLFASNPVTTNFCMSNKDARNIVSDYIVNFAKNHTNVDYLHVWLADSFNNHCECSRCSKKTPSDWYIKLLNETDEKLTKENLNMRIVFISYVDTTWAPLYETIKNPNRFLLMIAPIFRSYAYSVTENMPKEVIKPYMRNNCEFPSSLKASLECFEDWKKVWKSANVAFEYHLWRHHSYDISGLMQAKMLCNDVKLYKENNVDGIIQCGSQRIFFPTGFAFYAYARTLFDTSLSYEDIEQDYFSHLYGQEWKSVRDYLCRLYDALPFEFFSRDEAAKRENIHYDPTRAEKIAEIHTITQEISSLTEPLYSSDMRVQNVAAKLLENHAIFCNLIADWMSAKARGEIELAAQLLEKARIECGKFETDIQSYYDHSAYFSEYFYTQKQNSPSREDIVVVD